MEWMWKKLGMMRTREKNVWRIELENLREPNRSLDLRYCVHVANVVVIFRCQRFRTVIRYAGRAEWRCTSACATVHVCADACMDTIKTKDQGMHLAFGQLFLSLTETLTDNRCANNYYQFVSLLFGQWHRLKMPEHEQKIWKKRQQQQRYGNANWPNIVGWRMNEKDQQHTGEQVTIRFRFLVFSCASFIPDIWQMSLCPISNGPWNHFI